jgi:hypothetical protein
LRRQHGIAALQSVERRSKLLDIALEHLERCGQDGQETVRRDAAWRTDRFVVAARQAQQCRFYLYHGV